MALNISKILLPSIVGIVVYLTINKLFPEKLESWEKDPIKGLRGGDRMRLVKQITERLLKDKALKIAIIYVFATAGIQHFQSEIEALLVDDVFNTLCVNGVEDSELKVVGDIVQEHNLNSHAKSIKSLLVSNNLSQEQKISLLKIKLDFIINGEYSGKRRFLVMTIIGAVLAFSVSGVGGLALILEALYRLFQEGKISKALYKQIVKALTKRGGKIRACRAFARRLNFVIIKMEV
jgi:hypothetical protein